MSPRLAFSSMAGGGEMLWNSTRVRCLVLLFCAMILSGFHESKQMVVKGQSFLFALAARRQWHLCAGDATMWGCHTCVSRWTFVQVSQPPSRCELVHLIKKYATSAGADSLGEPYLISGLTPTPVIARSKQGKEPRKQLLRLPINVAVEHL